MAAAPTVEVANPRDPYKRRKATRSNYELYSWIFMRASGVVLVVLIFGHLFVNLMVGEGVHAIDFGFVAGKWASPFWQRSEEHTSELQSRENLVCRLLLE